MEWMLSTANFPNKQNFILCDTKGNVNVPNT